MRILIALAALLMLGGCAGARFDWQGTMESVSRGECRKAGNCDVVCPRPPEGQRLPSDCEQAARFPLAARS